MHFRNFTYEFFRPSVSWTNVTQMNVIKPKKEIHQHILQATIHLLNSTKSKKILEKKSLENFYKCCTEIGSILFKRCIERLREFIDFDIFTAVLAVECFYNVLQIILLYFRSNLKKFLDGIGRYFKIDDC